ncbi:hypothetical protein VNI00_014250 [Paramarasmius palmivorus]|uniref:Uncharacterized protein n=1 Tax=Paramarasmius palmivorus TaxID=297713 RepID=A0AAW0BUT0_9AGAR
MGQRHQAFLIARLTPHGERTNAHYRCIAAIHHQWCCGCVPLSGTRRFLALVKNPDNAVILLDEICRAQGKYGRQGEEPKVPEAAFPYAQMLLTLAFFLDVDDPRGGYSSGGGIEWAFVNPNMGLFDHANDDGMTIIDVTAPLNPTYGYGKPDGGYVLNTETYVCSYYRAGPANDNTEIDVRYHIDVMKNKCVIKAELVAEVWPEFLQGESLKELLKQLEGNVPVTGTFSTCFTPRILSRVVEQCAADATDSTETHSNLPTELKSVTASLPQLSENGLPHSTHTTLAQILQHELETNFGILDLSAPRCTLAADAIRTIIPLLPSDAVKGVNLSGMHTLTTQVIIDILETFPNVIRLTLLDTNISNEEIMHLLSIQPKLFYHLHDLVHPALLVRQAPSPAPSPSPQSITVIQTDRSGYYRLGPCITFIPFFHPEKLVQVPQRSPYRHRNQIIPRTIHRRTIKSRDGFILRHVSYSDTSTRTTSSIPRRLERPSEVDAAYDEYGAY